MIGEPLAKFLPGKGINLGLDLKGGIHLTLGVEVDRAVTNSLSLAGQELSHEAREKGILVLRPHVVAGKTIEFILPRSADREALDTLVAQSFPQLTLSVPSTLEAGQLAYSAHFKDQEIERIKSMAMDQALQTIRNRIDQFGVAEPDIRKESDHRIQIQLPGISDPRRAVQLLGQAAHLEFHMVRENVDPSSPVLPAGVVNLPLREGRTEDAARQITVEKEAILTGEDIADARPGFDQANQSYVALTFNTRGAAIFERMTAENVGRRMAIVLDGTVYSAPVIRERIGGGRASISGSFTTNEAQDLAVILRSGSMPAPVTVLEERTVGPSLGQESIDSGIQAGLCGALLVMAFMAVYYGLSGVIADGMLFFTLLIILAGMSAFGATLTLPGIAGIVLTIGMAVDANVLIYERIREELRKGFEPLRAVRLGFDRAAIAITDSNLTTIITAAILYQFGTGPVRGFAVTLTLGILGSMFTAVFVSHAIFELWARHCGKKGLSV